MKRLTAFIVIAVVFEIIALITHKLAPMNWVVDALIGIGVLYLFFLAVRGFAKQARLQLPPVQRGRVVHKRHWRMF